MNRFLSAIALMTITLSSSAQSQKGFQTELLNPDVIPVTFHGETGRLDDYRPTGNEPNPITKAEKIGYHPKNDWVLNPTVNPNALPKGEDPALQKEYAPYDATKAVTIGFNGIGYTGVNPADPSVDVGPGHVVQMINGSSGSFIEVFNKTGTSLFGPTYFDNFMSSMAGAPAVNGAGDPIVMYDERADRWVLTEFSPGGPNLLYVAVSTTPDPTGTYYVYSFAAPNFPDYPKYSIWTDSYIITTNESGNSPVYALNRTSLLSGTAGTAQRFTVPAFGTIGFQAATPVSLNGITLPPGNTPAMVMRMRDDAWAGSATDALEIWEFDIDWVTSANTSITLTNVLGIAAYESELCGYTSFACFDQPGGGQDLDPLREVLMNRIHYRNFGTHESIVCCHVADVDGTDHGGIRWYELRRTGGTAGTWAIYQQGTYSPDAADRWMASIGITVTGDILLAYNVVDETSNIYPSLRYTARKACDPLNVMTQPEATIVAGSARNASNRWGDYNQLGLDPSDGQTFWFTGKYNPNTQWDTYIAALTVDGACAPEVTFGYSTASVDEPDANVSSGCLDYYVVNVPISIALDPSQPADITVNVNPSSTATEGVDFDLNNTTFTFDGATLSGTVEVWVYNDNYIDGAETIVLDYTLNANGGNATAGSFNQTVTITVNDDDLDPVSMLNITTHEFQDFEAGFGIWTTNNAQPGPNDPWAIGDAATASSANWGVPTSNATDMAWVNDDACNCNQNNVYLTAPSVDLSGFPNAYVEFESFFEGNTYQGNTETAELQVSVGGGPFATVQAIAGSAGWVTENIDVSVYAGNANVQFRFRYSDGTGWLYGWALDDVRIYSEGPIDLQQAVNTGSGMTANLGPNETVHFYDLLTNDVMISLENTSNFDYGCVTVEVDRDGTAPTALQFTTTNTADYLHSKTYTVVPTNSNPTGTYNVTLYYKEAEVAAWEAFTGNSRNNVEIIKVAGNNRINDVNPANYTTYTIDNIPASLGTFYSDVTFTASFSTGFSGFGVGIYPTSTPVTHTVVLNNPTCNGGSDGSIVITASGGTSPYEYSINGGGTWSSSNTFSGLPAGSYDVIVRDATLTTSTLSVEVLNDPVAIPAPTAGADATYCDGDVIADLTATAGSGGTINWYDDASLSTNVGSGTTFSPSTAVGTVTYYAAETVGTCESAGTPVTVTINAAPAAPTVGSDSPICEGDDINLTASAIAGATYDWTGPGGFTSTSQNPTVSSATTAEAGIYSVTATVSGCTGNAGTVTVTVNAAPTFSIGTTSDPSSCGAADGSITLTGLSASTSYDVTYVDGSGTVNLGTVSTNGSGNYTITGLGADTYSNFTVAQSGCVGIQAGPVSLSDPSAPAAPTAGSNSPICEGDDIDLTASALAGATYSWTGPGGFTSSSQNPTVSAATTAESGAYAVTATVAGCTSSPGTVNVTVNAAPAAPTAGSNSPVCVGDNVDLTASIVAGATYSWTGPNGFVSGIQNPTIASATLATSGNYLVIATVAGCSSVPGTVNVLVNTAPSFTIGTSTNPSTCGGSNGSIQLTGLSAFTSYTITYNNGVGAVSLGAVTSDASGNYSIGGLAAGTYTDFNVSAGGCASSISTPVTLSDPSAPSSPTASNNGPVCQGTNVALTASLIAGASYSWNGPNGFTSSFQNPFVTGTTPASSGIYSVTATVGGCTSTTGTTVVTVIGTPTFAIGSTTDPSACAASDGTIQLNGLLPSTAYEITYSAGGSPVNLGAVTTDGLGNYVVTGLTAGNYTNFAVSLSGCSGSVGGAVSLSDPSSPLVTVSGTDPSAALACDGEVTATVSGGTTPYSIAWDDPGSQTGLTATGLCQGTYCASVVDAGGCATSACGSITDPGCALTVSVAANDPLCAGSADGSMLFSPASASGSVSYSIDGGATIGITPNFNGLSPGTYEWLVQDGAGCVETGIVVLTDPPAISYTVVTADSDCSAGTGQILIAASGGTGVLQFSINGGSSFQPTSIFTGLGGASYPVVVQDANGCQVGGNEVIGVVGIPVIDSISVTNVTCHGGSDGSVTVLVTTSVSPVAYSLDGGTTFQINNNVFQNVPFGAYNLVVYVAQGCQTTASTFVNEPVQVLYTAALSNENCGQSNGSLDLVGSNGIAPYQYSIDGGVSFQSAGTFTGLPQGIYDVMVVDDSGCVVSGTETVAHIDGPEIDLVQVEQVDCNGNATGQIHVLANGGSQPLEFSINGGSAWVSDTFFVSLPAGTYTLMVMDDVGCSNTVNVTVSEPDPLTAILQASDAPCGIANGSATALASGGTLPYTITWNDPASQSGALANTLVPGIYTATVADINGCAFVDSIQVSGSDSIFVEYELAHESCDGFADGTIITYVSGGTGDFSYLWSSGDTTQAIEGLEDGNYVLTVSDEAGCSVNAAIQVETDNIDCLGIPTAISPNADGANDTWNIQGIDRYPDALVEVYNKWGNLLYSSTDYQNNWDGTYNGTDLPAAVYYYIVKISDEEVYTGSITIIR